MPMKIKTISGHSAECEAGGLTQTVRIDFIKMPTRRLCYGTCRFCH